MRRILCRELLVHQRMAATLGTGRHADHRRIADAADTGPAPLCAGQRLDAGNPGRRRPRQDRQVPVPVLGHGALSGALHPLQLSGAAQATPALCACTSAQ